MVPKFVVWSDFFRTTTTAVAGLLVNGTKYIPQRKSVEVEDQ